MGGHFDGYLCFKGKGFESAYDAIQRIRRIPLRPSKILHRFYGF